MSAPELSLQRPPLRLWPGLVLVLVEILLRYVVPAVAPGALVVGMLGSLACAVGVLIWWLFFSRAPWLERLGAIALMAATLLATRLIVHPSIRGGMMGMMLPVMGVPVLSIVLVAWAVATRQLATVPRRALLVAATLVACGGWTLVRTGGFSSDLRIDWAWRWAPTPEERLLAAGAPQPVPTNAKPKLVTERSPRETASWPGFRGPNRDSVVRGVRIETDWAASPPVELWRRPIGPGWSSFAVSNDVAYTQEQRGEHEIVACYQLSTGEVVWQHQDATRFWESNAGPGPRGTPTLHEGRVYTFGGTGLLNALDAATGAVAWTRNVAAETKKQPPEWGFASSPLVVGDLVVIAATGTLAAYDRATGAPRWFGPADGKSYSSPQLAKFDGVPQILLMSGLGLTSVAPADGKVLWQHEWPDFAIVQPAQIDEHDLLLSTGDRRGARRIEVVHANGRWTTNERWTSNRLKAYFNDFVLHSGHAYGFDGGMLTCVDLADGGRKWKGGRYGSGQLLLLADQDLLLVVSEQGELALVRAAPDQFTELGRIAAITGKTWNHPVLAGDIVLVRNGEEMAAFRVKRRDT